MSVIQVGTDISACLVTNTMSTASMSYKQLVLPFGVEILSGLGRVLYLKEAAESEGSPVFSVATVPQMFVQNSTILYLNSNEALTLQYFSSLNYGILGGYPGVSTFATCLQSNADPTGAQIVNPSLQTSTWLVDLRTQSKALVLPPIASIGSNVSQAPFYTVKDIYGNAATNNLFISSSVDNILEHRSTLGCIRINQNYASIDLAANRFLNKWHILNYYDGTLVSNPP
jgi:hypothetical protein